MTQDEMDKSGRDAELVPNAAAREILVEGARAVAEGDGLAPSLEVLLGVIAEQLDVDSAVVVIVDGRSDRLSIVAAYGLGNAAAAGLADAIRNPRHPITRTVAEPVSSFDVQPTAPGGPALRTHLPLIVMRDGTKEVLGVLALAHDRPIAAPNRPLLEAAANLAAIAIERHRGRPVARASG